MTNKLDIPAELQDAFQRLMKLVPAELRDNAHIQKTILVYLKFGGERLARHNIGIMKKPFDEKINLINKRNHEEDIEETSEFHTGKPESGSETGSEAMSYI